MNLNSLNLLTLTIVVLSISSACSSRRVVTWRNLEEFLKAGWDGYSSPGAFFTRPSQVNSTLAPLDSGVTGGAAWSGDETASRYWFYLNYTSFENYENIIEANITINYFYSGRSPLIIFRPCTSHDGRCYLNGTIPMEWNTASFAINLTAAETLGSIDLVTSSQGISLLNEVSISYETDGLEPTTENPNVCSESCEYRAIDCHNYYSCIDYSYKKYFTCAEEDGLAFNPEIGMCDRMEFVEGCAPHCEYRPDYNNCSNYYYCPDILNEDLCELKSCPHGLLYSVDEQAGVQQCTVPSKAKCATDLNNA